MRVMFAMMLAICIAVGCTKKIVVSYIQPCPSADSCAVDHECETKHKCK